jgi:acyl dehydratase
MRAPIRLRKTVSRVQIAKYAAATGDFNALHFDDEHARRAGLPGVIGHGLLTLGFGANAVTEWCDGDPNRVASLSMRFREAIRPGDELEVIVVHDGDPSDDVQRLAIDIRRGETTVASGSATVRPSGT